MKKNGLIYTGLILVILVIFSLILSFWLPIGQSFRVIFALFILLFLPGYVWTLLFWNDGEIDYLERAILSLIFSIIIVPLFIFLLNKIGVKIILGNIIWEILVVLIIPLVIKFFPKKLKINFHKT